MSIYKKSTAIAFSILLSISPAKLLAIDGNSKLGNSGDISSNLLNSGASQAESHPEARTCDSIVPENRDTQTSQIDIIKTDRKNNSQSIDSNTKAIGPEGATTYSPDNSDASRENVVPPMKFKPQLFMPAPYINTDGRVKIRIADPEHPFGKLMNLVFEPATKWMEKLAGLSPLDKVAQKFAELTVQEKTKTGQEDPNTYWRRVEQAGGIKTESNKDYLNGSLRLHLTSEDIANERKTPNKGIMFLGNHTSSWELINAAALAEGLGRRTPLIVLNPGLRNWPGIGGVQSANGHAVSPPHAIFIIPFKDKASRAYNATTKGYIENTLRSSGTIIIAPSGAVSARPDPTKEFSYESPWELGAAKNLTQTPNTLVVPFFSNHQSIEDLDVAKRGHNLIKTGAAILKNIATKVEDQSHQVTYGSPISRDFLMKVGGFGDLEAEQKTIAKEQDPTQRELLIKNSHFDEQGRVKIPLDATGKPDKKNSFFGNALKKITAYLHARTYFLHDLTVKPEKREMQEIIRPIANEVIVDELFKSPKSKTIYDSNPKKPNDGYLVIQVYGRDIPNTMNEIGRLREETFRPVGEGSGKASDTDTFDQHYVQLVLIDKAAKAKADAGLPLESDESLIAGGYRIGKVDEILNKLGPQGVYSTSLFEFLKLLTTRHSSGTIEAGRSFIIQRHQGKNRSLLHLWKGMAEFLANEAADGRVYTKLIGPVSLSETFPDNTKILISKVAMNKTNSDPEHAALAKSVKGRSQVNFRSRLTDEDWDILVSNHPDFGSLDTLIKDAQSDPTAKIPPLFGLYSEFSTIFLGSNMDRDFGTLDFLIETDLMKTDSRKLMFYMGKETAARYWAAVEKFTGQKPNASPL